MNTFQMRDKLKERLSHLDVDFKFNREEETLRIYRTDNNKGITIKLNAIVAKYEDKKEKIVDEIVYYVDEAIAQMADKTLESISSNSQIMPVIIVTSFDKKTKQGVPFIDDEHTAETAVYYAVDLGKSYRLIDESMLEDLKLTEQQIKKCLCLMLENCQIQYH